MHAFPGMTPPPWARLALLLLSPALADPIVLPLTRRFGLGPGERRRLSPTDEARLFGNLHRLHSWHVDVLVGTPGQMQSVIVDTGSGMTAFPCTECGANCGTHIDEPFDPSRSSTFRWVSCSESHCRSCESNDQCGYSVHYLEGSSIRGRFFEDVLHLGHAARNNTRAPVWLGCHTEETNLFLRQDPSGIMGLREENWDVLTALVGGPLERQVLGLCLSDDGGAMAFGGINESWTPLEAPLESVPYGTHYSVSVTDASLVTSSGQSTSVASLAGNYIFDSGTTYTYFTAMQAEALRTAVRNACGAGACGGATLASTTCWMASDADLSLFPNLHISMGQATYIWTPRGYLTSQHAGHWCYTFYGDPPLTLGASFMRHHLVVFNRDEQRISFAPSPCPSITLRSDTVPLHAIPDNPALRLPSAGTESTSGTASGCSSLRAALVFLGLAVCVCQV